MFAFVVCFRTKPRDWLRRKNVSEMTYFVSCGMHKTLTQSINHWRMCLPIACGGFAAMTGDKMAVWFFAKLL